jgi:hypothetical protein
MISAISSQGSVRFMVYQDAMNQQRLIRFMERLMRTSEGFGVGVPILQS